MTVHKPRGKDRKFIAITLGCVSKTEHTHLKRELQKHKLESRLGLLAKIECSICSYKFKKLAYNIWEIHFKIYARIISPGESPVYLPKYYSIEGYVLLLKKRPNRETRKGHNGQFTGEAT